MRGYRSISTMRSCRRTPGAFQGRIGAWIIRAESSAGEERWSHRPDAPHYDRAVEDEADLPDMFPAEVMAELEAERMRVLTSLGYEPPPHALDDERARRLVNPPGWHDLVAREVSPYEAASIREAADDLVRQLAHLEPDDLSLDPFLGERDTSPQNLESIRTVVRAEEFVSTVSDEARRVGEQIRALRPDLLAARGLIAGRQEELATMRAAAAENLEHVHARQENLSVEGGAQRDLLEAAYRFDALQASQVVRVSDFGGTVHDLDATVAALLENSGAAADAAHDDYAASIRQRRRTRRFRRTAIRLCFAAAIALATVLLDQVLQSIWNPAGSFVLAAVVLLVDPRVQRALDRRTRLAQVEDLSSAVARTERLLRSLLEREVSVNVLRAVLGLPPIKIVGRPVVSFFPRAG